MDKDKKILKEKTKEETPPKDVKPLDENPIHVEEEHHEPKHQSSGDEFLSSISWGESETDTLVIYCSDHRFQEHFNEFIHKHLLTKPDVLAIPGGPQVLIAASYIEKFEWAGKRWVKFLRDKHNLRRIVCIAHEDCGWYKNITIGNLTIPLLKNRQISDLKKIGEALKDMFPKVEVEMWYADKDGDRVKFSKIKNK